MPFKPKVLFKKTYTTTMKELMEELYSLKA